MPSMKQNMGMLRNCPPIDELYPLIEAHGMPEDARIGIFEHAKQARSITVTLKVSGQLTVKQIDAKTKAKTVTTVDKVDFIRFRVIPDTISGHGIVEVYDGNAKTVEEVQQFLRDGLATEIAGEPIDVDPIALFSKLQDAVKRAELKSAKLAGYQHDEQVVGPYSPRFATSAEGVEFLERQLESKPAPRLKSITTAWKRDKKKCGITITPESCFRVNFAEGKEDYVTDVVRYLVGAPRLGSFEQQGMEADQPEEDKETPDAPGDEEGSGQ